MSEFAYIARVLTGVRFRKMNRLMDVVKEKCGQPKLRTFFDMLGCAMRYGAGYYDYVMFGFYDMTDAQRDTYLTRVRNKRIQDIMNPPDSREKFDDKLAFNVTFASFLHRRTLNGETCSLAEFTDFIDGQEAVFAKRNHGDCGVGVEKLYAADFDSPASMLAYIRERRAVVLEHVLPQHPDFARLHPASVNTMRIVTDVVGSEVHIAYITLKIGRGNGFCDNSGQGGVLCRVDPDSGCITSGATDDYFHFYDRHPDTGITFAGYRLPMVDEAIALAKRAAGVLGSDFDIEMGHGHDA